ncbi:MAG: ABC transporter permease [Endomicrobiia bacterium]
MNYTIYLAIKYLKPQKDKFFSYLSLIISVLGIATGVCTLIVTLAVMTGFHKEIKSRLMAVYPHILITSAYDIDEKIFAQFKEIKNFSPFIYSQAIIKNEDKVYSCVVKGIDYDKEKKVVNLTKIVKVQDNFSSLNYNQIILGKELAKNLNVVVNDEIVLVLPTQMQTPLGSFPLTEKFIVAGFISSGIYEYDNNLCFINYDMASKLFYNKNTNETLGIKGFGLKLKDDSQIEILTNKLRTILGPTKKVVTWIEMNYNLFSALKLEKIIMIIVVSLIIIVACFIIMSNLLLKGIQKNKDIGILMAVGVDRKSVKKIFFFQGMIINLSGIFLGTVLGFFLGFLIKEYQFIKLPKEVYYIDKIPVYFNLVDIILALSIAVIVGIIASIYPSHKISQFNPVEIIRYG